MHRLAIEVATFDRLLPFLLLTDIGKFALVKDDRLHGVFALYDDALEAAHDRFPDEPFLVRLVAPEDEVPFPFLLAWAVPTGQRGNGGRSP